MQDIYFLVILLVYDPVITNKKPFGVAASQGRAQLKYFYIVLGCLKRRVRGSSYLILGWIYILVIQGICKTSSYMKS